MALTIEEASWPEIEMIPVAAIRYEPGELVRIIGAGLEFMDTFDQLDYCQLASIRLPSGASVMLLRHRGNPYPGTELHADISLDAESVIEEFVSESGIDEVSVVWRRGQDWPKLDS